MSSQPLAISEPAQRTPSGIWGAVLLTVNGQGHIDWGALSEQLHILCESGVDGIYTNGTAGEFHNQTEDEFDRLSELVASTAIARSTPFQIGVSQTNARVARERLGRIIELQPSGVQFTLPDWWCLSTMELETFLLGMQQAAGSTPMILYNPPHAKQQLALSQIHEFKSVMPNLVGAKLPGGDSNWYQDNILHLEALSVFIPGHTVAFGRPKGASGSYSNVACLSPAGAVRHWHLIETDTAAAIELELRINVFMQNHVVPLARKDGLSNMALDKLMAAAGNWGPVGPDLLWPYRSATVADVSRVGKAARAEIPELFDHL